MVWSALRGVPQLTQLNLQHCPGVGLPSKAALTSLKPGLTIKLQTPWNGSFDALNREEKLVV